MKRGSIFFVTLVMLLGAIVLLLLIGKLGINGYASYDWKFENLAMQKGVTGNSIFDDLWNKLFGGDEQEEEKVNFLASPSARTIYVDNNLTGDCITGDYNIAGRSCGGSDGLAFNTIQKAADNVSAGDTVLVRGETQCH